MVYKIMFLAVIAACIGPFFINGPDGKKLLTVDQFIKENNLDDLKDVATSLPTNLSSLSKNLGGKLGDKQEGEQAIPNRVTIYKWRDAEGIWQFSTSPPTDVEELQSFELGSDVNIIPAPGSAGEVLEEKTSATAVSLPQGLTSISPDQLEKLMKQVNNMQQTVDQRKETIDRAIGNQ